jgi:serine/threonine protein kinase
MPKIKNLSNKGPYIIMEGDVFKSYGACNLKLTKPFTNLDLVTITTNLREEIDIFPKKFSFKIYYDGKKMKKKKTIKDGANGIIYIYAYGETTVVVKIPVVDDYIDDEVNVIKNILPNECHNYIIPYKIIYDKYNNPFVIMQEANGTLDELKLDGRLVAKILIEITKMLICFYEQGIIYYDLKSDNILYTCLGREIALFLGDLGSFVKEGDYFSGGFYLPPEALDDPDTIATKELLIFTIGCFAADLFGFQEEIGYSNSNLTSSKAMIEEEYPKFLDKITNSNIPKNIKALIIAFTDMDPVKRREQDLSSVFVLLED